MPGTHIKVYKGKCSMHGTHNHYCTNKPIWPIAVGADALTLEKELRHVSRNNILAQALLREPVYN